ncbi:MAG: hypothetical protein JSU08_17705 [Acidobacteria bacterium]|nr:hypothetical protein [Acidobacteriota bacterium]
MRHTALVLLVSPLLLASCGGGTTSSSTTNPSPAPAATITITSSGVSPKSVTVKPGSQVQFVNNDSRSHQINSDPHPEHTDCPELNAVGFLSPGTSRQTGNLNTVRTCRYHDHDLPTNQSFQGAIVIQ